MKEADLEKSLAPIRGMFLAQVIHALIESDMATELASPDGLSRDDLSERHDSQRSSALVRYAIAEGLIEEKRGRLFSTPRLNEFVAVAPWYDMFVGGYGRSFLDLPELVNNSELFAERDVSWVGKGSAEIGRHDVIPLFQELMRGRRPERLIDLGSADGVCLAVLGRELGLSNLLAVEPDENSANRARLNLQAFDGAQVTTGTAQDFVESADPKDLRGTIIVAFVLHELLAQKGRKFVIAFLRKLLWHPENRILIAEVDPTAEIKLLATGIGAAYYNPYILLHEVTKQELRDKEYWSGVVEEAGGKVERSLYPNLEFDSTKIEFVWLITPRESDE